ncbi:unnamed protein product [Miscanthus lutarioriparius]|uniref:Uncharacterized protein n=1 Tax=Miscanthus lutarioriparius TaxID=422564 RepID=A0A811R8Q2_9POAL|nr:unnamed protein product [Miscanthus lutarioriparius]
MAEPNVLPALVLSRFQLSLSPAYVHLRLRVESGDGARQFVLGGGVGLVWVSLPGAGRAPTTVRSGGGVGLVRVSLPGAGRAPTTVRSGGGVGLVRVSLPGAGRARTTVRSGGGVGLVRVSLLGAGRTVGRFPPSRAKFAKPAEQGPPGHLKGAALAGLLTCYKPATGAALCYVSNNPSPSSLNDPCSLKMRPSTKSLMLFLTRSISFIKNYGRAYLEAELNKLAKTMFFSFTNDDKVKESLHKLIEEGVDTTFYHIASLKTWYRWLRGK